MNKMSKRHENEQFIRDIHMCDGKNIDFDERIAQTEKVSNLTGKPEYVLALAKSSGTSYKIIFQTPSNTGWNKLKRNLQEVYSLVETDMHVATDVLRKQYVPMNGFKITLLTGMRCVIEAWNMICWPLIISLWSYFL